MQTHPFHMLPTRQIIGSSILLLSPLSKLHSAKQKHAINLSAAAVDGENWAARILQHLRELLANAWTYAYIHRETRDL